MQKPKSIPKFGEKSQTFPKSWEKKFPNFGKRLGIPNFFQILGCSWETNLMQIPNQFPNFGNSNFPNFEKLLGIPKLFPEFGYISKFSQMQKPKSIPKFGKKSQTFPKSREKKIPKFGKRLGIPNFFPISEIEFFFLCQATLS